MKRAILIVLLGMMTTHLPAQPIDFSGTWKLNLEKTNIPGLPAFKLFIDQKENEIQYTKEVPQQSGQIIITKLVMSLDGKECAYTDYDGKQLSCSASLNGPILMVNFQSEQFRGGKKVLLQMKDECSLSEDGKILSVIHFEGVEGRTGRYPNPLVFDRMEAAEKKDAAAVQVQTPAPQNGNFTKQQLIEDTRELLDYLENIHPDPYLYSGGKVAFHRRFQNVLQAIPADGMTRDEYNRLLSPFLASIRDAHTGILTPYEFDRDAPGGIPLSFASVENWIYVHGVIQEAHRFLIGSKLISVQGNSFADLKQRLAQMEGIENEYHGLFILSYYLCIKPYLSELIPEWKDFSKISAEFELADGNKREMTFCLPVVKKSPTITNKTRIQLPSTEKCEFGYAFLSPDKKTAVLKVDQMTAYREGMESESMSRDITKAVSEAYKKIHGKDAPETLEEALAGIPSAIEMFKKMLDEMRQAGTENLIVDLSKNPGGFSLMADILTYFLYGREALVGIIVEETQVKKYSPYFFQRMTGRTIEGLNQQYSQIQSYPLTVNDYDFSVERYVQLAVSGKLDTLTGLRLKYQNNPSFLQEIESGTYDKTYTPKNVLAVSSNRATVSEISWS